MFPDLLTTPRVMLRPIASEDAGPIFQTYAQDAEVTRFLIWKPHKRREESEAYVAQCLAQTPDLARTYALCDRKTGALLGAFALRQLRSYQVDFGCVLARPSWGQGLMTEALAAAVDWALAQPENFRVGAVCDVDNIGSARVMEKAGLMREGLLRRWLVHPNISDEPRDCLSFAKVR